MKEIKFRAWDNKKKEWLMGYEMPNLGGFSLFGEMVLLGEWAGVLDTFLFSRDGYTPDDLKVMQFTGLKDKNGKEIYEGDILEYRDANYHRRVVSWNENKARWAVRKIGGRYDRSPDHQQMPDTNMNGVVEYPKKWEVIGNIYENAELVTPQK